MRKPEFDRQKTKYKNSIGSKKKKDDIRMAYMRWM